MLHSVLNFSGASLELLKMDKPAIREALKPPIGTLAHSSLRITISLN